MITELVWAGQECFSFHCNVSKLTVGPIQSFIHWLLEGLSEWYSRSSVKHLYISICIEPYLHYYRKQGSFFLIKISTLIPPKKEIFGWIGA